MSTASRVDAAENAAAIPVDWRRAGLATLSGLLLALPYNTANFFPLMWIAFVPLLIAVHDISLRASYQLGLFAGLAFYTTAAPWIVDFLSLFKGFDQGRSFGLAVVFWVYCAQLPALLVVGLGALRKWTNVSDVLVFPVLVVAVYAGFPMLFTVQLGESQSAFLTGIQAVAITGVYGLDFAIALVNVVVFRAILYRWKKKPSSQLSVFSALGFLGLWFGYGLWSLGHWDIITADWQTTRVGFVQPGDPPALGSAPIYPGYSRAYPPEMAMSARLSEAGAQLIVWPEGPYKHFLDDPRVEEAYLREAARLDVDILAQDIEHIDSEVRYNSVVVLKSNGERSAPYRKIKRVAFGESLPVSGVPVLDDLVRRYLGRFFRGVEAGRERELFETADFAVAPLICYEVMYPVFTARGLANTGTNTVLVAVSSDGWFGDSVQPHQHANASILRAVENRVPLLHVINNGPSVLALPNGRQVLRTQMHQPGGYLVELPHSLESGNSFFNRYPHWFIGGIYLGLLILGAVGLGRALRGRFRRSSKLFGD
ncbi:apolipoprotein N-acyltransferase [Proteobacteria bacterium 005FR1]|nr:apolipoprotein N-acyltransferase [Proteobacteria bacterium 005FR1]